ncbi:MAG: DUF4329 domain-containing protein [Clostridiales bacterium]|jgi:hypothetical protein|nr:DUF4329 domain-containing protein [Clostridiales bacterium]
MAKEYVYMGAALKCPFGSADSKLMMTPQHRVQSGGKFKANIGDAKPMVNIMPFGTCKSMANPTVAAATAAANGVLQQMPCTPVTAVWIGGMANVLIDKMPALMKNDKLLCTFGQGMITIKDSGQGSGGKSGSAAAGNDPARAKDGDQGSAKEATATEMGSKNDGGAASPGPAHESSYDSPDAAAEAWGKDNNQRSIDENKEYSSEIYKEDGKYKLTPPIAGEEATVGEGTIPKGAELSGGIHSHGAKDPRYDSENFSFGDKGFSKSRGVPEYISTPGGTLKKYEPATGKVSVLSSGMPKDPK